jgi:hypothetical protein
MLFKTGNLNPGLLNTYIDFPDRVMIFNNPHHPATLNALAIMQTDVKEMKEICEVYNAKLIFANLPMNYFTGHLVDRNPSDVLNGYFQVNNYIDSMYSAIATKHQIKYVELTRHFSDLAEKEKYFFRYDGHPTTWGYYEIAFGIGNALIESKLLD